MLYCGRTLRAVGKLHQNNMSGERQEYAKAEDRKRMLSTQGNGPQNRPLQWPPVWWCELYRYDSQCEKVNQTQQGCTGGRPAIRRLQTERQGRTPDLFLAAIIHQTAMACLVHCSRSCGSLGTNALPALA